jgi:5-bromo-4-chloroindolyl phosphate hydrolysis protein
MSKKRNLAESGLSDFSLKKNKVNNSKNKVTAVEKMLKQGFEAGEG